MTSVIVLGFVVVCMAVIVGIALRKPEKFDDILRFEDEQ